MALALLLLLPAPYAAVAVGYSEARRRDARPPAWARVAGPLAVLAHLLGLVVLGLEKGRSPFHTTSQALSFLAFSLAAIYALLELTTRVVRYGGGFYLLAATLAAGGVPGLAGEAATAVAARARDPMLSYHMGFALLGTAAIAASGLLGVGYLGAYRRMKDRRIALDPGKGLSLFGLQRLAKHASTAGVLLLAPSLALGGLVVHRAERPSSYAYLEMALAGVQLLLVFAAAFLWWRRPRRGAVAAWLDVLATVVAVATFLVVHPLLAGTVGAG